MRPPARPPAAGLTSSAPPSPTLAPPLVTPNPKTFPFQAREKDSESRRVARRATELQAERTRLENVIDQLNAQLEAMRAALQRAEAQEQTSAATVRNYQEKIAQLEQQLRLQAEKVDQESTEAAAAKKRRSYLGFI